jgi:predicted ATP-grasp superfamily ATP-dependent carboligase
MVMMPRKVLILDANQRSALAATRSLGSKDIPVVVADQSVQTLAGASRFCREGFVYPSPYLHSERFLETVQQESSIRGVGVIFPMTEISAELVLKSRAQLEGVEIPFASFPAFERLTDKGKLLELARELGVPVPRTWFVERAEAVEGIMSELEFPVVLKPRRSRLLSAGRWQSTSVRYARSAEELRRSVASLEFLREHPFLVQECVQGEGRGIFALCNRGEPVVFFAHRRLRENPPSGGVSTLSESVNLDPRMQEYAAAILRAVRWHGVAMVEFKCGYDGRICLMEVNARFWGSLQLAIDAGVDFPWLLYRLAVGEAPPVNPGYTVGVRSRWLMGDVAHLYKVLHTNSSGHGLNGWRKRDSIMGFLNFFDRRVRWDVNRWHDWRPFVRELRNRLFG